jgi:hypothetical protein
VGCSARRILNVRPDSHFHHLTSGTELPHCAARRGQSGAVADRNWMHEAGHDEQVMAEFERRLANARPGSRPGYLRVKAATLLASDDPAARRVAIDLLQRVVTTHDDFLEVPFAHELLGDAYRHEGDLEASERHLRLCLQTADERRNGTTGITELTLAEVLLEQGRTTEAGTLLADDALQGRLRFKSALYRYAVAVAQYEAATNGDPKPWAARALDLAHDTTPQFSRHPTVGLPQPDSATIEEMGRLASST